MPHIYERNKITATQIRSLQDGNVNWIKKTANGRFSVRYKDYLKRRRALPVYSKLENFLPMIQGKNQVVVLSSDTGSGKTTQITQIAMINDFKELRKGGLRVICTQPRVVAATESAERVAEELDVELGQEVGYRVKNNPKVTKGVTLLEFVTEGILLNELMSSETVPQYTTIIIDEVHERTLNTDTILLLLKDVIKRRVDLKVVIMSATLDAERFQNYFPGSQRIHITG
jgi:pre-mRNA-splicing factor ATP-dependent RNA helicase DHX15/PRP43